MNGPLFGSRTDAIANARQLLKVGDHRAAVEQLREVVDGDPDCAEAHRLLGIALRKLDDVENAHAAESRAIELASLEPDIFQATLAIAENRLDSAERLLRSYLAKQPDDAAALRLLAEIAFRLGRNDAAAKLLNSALGVAPRFERAKLLLERVRKRSASKADPMRSPGGDRPLSIDATEQYAEAMQLYERVVSLYPDSPENWVSYGHILRTVGKQDEAINAYRRAIEARPSTGEAWWAIADLKTRILGPADIEQLETIIADGATPESELPALHFALGRALELAGLPDRAFQSYRQGNMLRAAELKHDRDAVSVHVDKSLALFTRSFFEERRGMGCDAPDPIFVLGMPRAGSTLVEQILASHPDVEGTMELPDINAIATWLGEGKSVGFEASSYLERLEALSGPELKTLGQGYIWGTGLRRQTSRPYFIDKMPNNWLHVGMILAILPEARIIDARRNPMACGLSIYRQHFARGQAFSYDLVDIGSFYANYARMMAHFDELFPRRIIRIHHEQLVLDPERVIRDLLERLGLGFDAACLKFHENRRAVRTSSSEQVRKPISSEGLDQWRQFETWLGPLRESLGPVIDDYRAYADVG